MFLNLIIRSYKFTSAINENKTREIFLTISMTVIWLLSMVGITFAFFQTTKITYLTTILGVIFSILYSTQLQIMSKIYKNQLLQIISRVLSTHPSLPSFVDKTITQRAEQRMEHESGNELLFFIFSLASFTLCPQLNLLVKPGITFDHPDLQFIPFFHSYWKTNNYVEYLSKLLFEMTLAAMSIIAYYNFAIFMVYTIKNLEVHTEELNRLFSNAIDTNVKKFMPFDELYTRRLTTSFRPSCFVTYGRVNAKWKHDYEKSTREELVKIIKYHQFIHNYITDVRDFLHASLTGLFAWYIVSTILFTYTFLQVTDDYVFFCKMLCVVLHSTAALRVYCNAAEAIFHMNERIMDSFYNTSWYYLLPESRKDLLFMMTLCQRKYKMKSFGMYVVNLNLFIQALRIVYSVLNIVMVIQKK